MKNLKIYIKLILTAFFWGGTFVSGRVVSQEVEPFTAAFFRFVFATFFLVLLTRKFEGKLPRLTARQVFLAALSGLFGALLYNYFFLEGLKTVAAGRASVIIAANPVFIFLASVLLFREKINSVKITGILISFTGAVWVISRGNPLNIMQGEVGWGEILILACVGSWVAYSIVGKFITTNLAPMASVTYGCLIGALMLLGPALMETDFSQLRDFSFKAWANMFYLGFFGSSLGFSWYYEGIKTIGPARAGIFINFVPVSGVFLGWLILGEPLDSSIIIGACLVIGGIFILNRRG